MCLLAVSIPLVVEPIKCIQIILAIMSQLHYCSQLDTGSGPGSNDFSCSWNCGKCCQLPVTVAVVVCQSCSYILA